jgi:hypothetical protein
MKKLILTSIFSAMTIAGSVTLADGPSYMLFEAGRASRISFSQSDIYSAASSCGAQINSLTVEGEFLSKKYHVQYSGSYESKMCFYNWAQQFN